MTWSVRYIALEHLSLAWPVAAPLLAPAIELSEGRYDLASVYEKLAQKFALLWLIDDDKDETVAAFVSRIAAYPRRKLLSIDFMGGERMTEWVGTTDAVLENYARDAGLDGIEMVGRAGWSRTLGAFGWRQNAVMLIRPVTAGGRNFQGR